MEEIKTNETVKPVESDMESVSILELFDGKITNEYHDVNFNGKTFKVKELLSLPEISLLISSVLEKSYSSDGVYKPELRELVIRLFTIILYTNIKIDVDMIDAHLASYSPKGNGLVSSLYDTILHNISISQYCDIKKSIEAAIDYKNNIEMHEIKTQINSFVNQFSGFNEEMGKMFEGVDKAEFNEFISKLAEGNIDEEKIAKAVINNAGNTKA